MKKKIAEKKETTCIQIGIMKNDDADDPYKCVIYQAYAH